MTRMSDKIFELKGTQWEISNATAILTQRADHWPVEQQHMANV